MEPNALCENATLSRIGVVDVQEVRVLAIFNLPSRPSWGSAWSMRNLWRCGPVRIFAIRAQLFAGIMRVRSLSLWSWVNFLRLRATVCQDQAAQSQLFSAKVLRKLRPRSSGCNVATFHCSSSQVVRAVQRAWRLAESAAQTCAEQSAQSQNLQKTLCSMESLLSERCGFFVFLHIPWNLLLLAVPPCNRSSGSLHHYDIVPLCLACLFCFVTSRGSLRGSRANKRADSCLGLPRTVR